MSPVSDDWRPGNVDRAMSTEEAELFQLQIIGAELQSGLRCPKRAQRARASGAGIRPV
jgi:hypothetical protein